MAHFDDAAVQYDNDFSHAAIGSRLRSHVWNMMTPYIPAACKDVLEINCGTGEDAVYLADKGYNVTATDASPVMIQVANTKTRSGNPLFRVVEFNDIDKKFAQQSFDFVFSNFGGLNCASHQELKGILEGIHKLLRPGGVFVAVIMGSRCMWEQAYYLLKRDTKRAFRRYKKYGSETIIGSRHFKTYYYSPADVKRMACPMFTFVKQHPIGFFIPPTFTEHYFKKHINQLDALVKLENSVKNTSILANMADHFMIVLKN
jgi:SAM-dependent methyltransferase